MRVSSAFMSSHTSFFFSGARSRYDGWKVHITGMPRYSKNLPRSLVMPSVAPSRYRAGVLPSRQRNFGRTSSIVFSRYSLQFSASSGSGVRFLGGRQRRMLQM